MQVESTKERIIDVAWDLFYKKGYKNTTIDEIINECGVSKGGFYHHFRAKDDLLKTLGYVLDREYEKNMKLVAPEMDSFEKLIFFSEQAFKYIEVKIPLNILALVYSTQVIKKGEKFLLDDERTYYRLLNKMIEEGQKNGELINTRSSRELAKFYAMQERNILYDWCMCEGNYPLSTYGVDMLRFFLDGIRSKDETTQNGR